MQTLPLQVPAVALQLTGIVRVSESPRGGMSVTGGVMMWFERPPICRPVSVSRTNDPMRIWPLCGTPPTLVTRTSKVPPNSVTFWTSMISSARFKNGGWTWIVLVALLLLLFSSRPAGSEIVKVTVMSLFTVPMLTSR